MVGDQYANAAAFKVFNDALNFDHRNGIDASKGFVQQNKARRRRQRARDFNATALAPGERGGGGVAQVRDAQLLEQLVQTVGNHVAGQRLTAWVGLQLKNRTNVLLHIELAKNRRFLRQVAQTHARPHVHGLAVDRGAIEVDGATVATHQAHQHVKRRGFARTIGAQQAHHLTLGDIQ